MLLLTQLPRLWFYNVVSLSDLPHTIYRLFYLSILAETPFRLTMASVPSMTDRDIPYTYLSLLTPILSEDARRQA